jgi:hypothetical protein
MMNAQNIPQLPIPSHFNAAKVGEVWRVPYQQRAAESETYAKQQNIPSAALDKNRICLSRLALKIVVMARQKARGKRQE